MRKAARLKRLTRRRRVRFALVLSFLVHALVVLIVVGSIRAPEPERSTNVTEIVRFERRPRPTPPPIPRPEPRPTPAPRLTAPRERAAAPLPAPRQTPVPRPQAVLPKVAHVPRRETPHAKRQEPTLSDQRIAAITARLGAAIANDQRGLDPLAHTATAAIAAPKHYGMDVSSFTAGGRSGHGLCDPVKDWSQDGFDYYYVACNVRFGDGTYQRQSVPWPVRFPPDDDPFAGTAKGEKPLAMPLPGWTLPAGETITPELRAYAADHGVTI